MKNANLKVLFLSLLLTLGGGSLIGYFIRDSIFIYETLNKPWFFPPPIIFPIVWAILYILMAVAAYIIYKEKALGKNIDGALKLYLVQLILNFLWAIIFFKFNLYGIAFIELCILIIIVLIMTIKFFKINRIAGILLIPYLLWIIYAGILNFIIWTLNEM
ncbi:TspO and MBR related proteins [Clostridium cavendishii DSM 21758]|uniref:TspO and MBR related proteins n=1 Tax=Clostridium cavendishii DSM 21758 TaxID=1121302 RepID=A0A1M6NR49_9CLOT|nr:TspO/MBR family protein [Clostridium cavendishii]SHJ98164.1 TspO and MBR related proteins [Clostridium cavendishii DSM 21758]